MFNKAGWTYKYGSNNVESNQTFLQPTANVIITFQQRRFYQTLLQPNANVAVTFSVSWVDVCFIREITV